MSENVILKVDPKIEFRFLDNGFQLIDGQTERNSGFYPYTDLQSSDLNKVWYPMLAKWLRAVTWVLNGVPYFPDGETCKNANLIIRFRSTNLGIWLTDTHMADKARTIKALLDQKTKNYSLS